MAAVSPFASPAYWVVRQTLLAWPEALLTVSAYCEHHQQFTHRLRLTDLPEQWPWVFTALAQLNLHPTRPSACVVFPTPSMQLPVETGCATLWLLLKYASASRRQAAGTDYSRAERLDQLRYWAALNLHPSWVVDYGEGLVCVWRLGQRIPHDRARQLMTYMHAAAASYRVRLVVNPATWAYPLPGFLTRSMDARVHSVSSHVIARGPACLLHPADYSDVTLSAAFAPETFSSFPASHREIVSAWKLTGVLPKRLSLSSDKAARQATPLISEVSGVQALQAQMQAVWRTDKTRYTPLLAVMPSYREVPLRSRIRRALDYVRLGRKLPEEHMAQVVFGLTGKTLHRDEVDKREVDERLVAEFVRLGYTEDAVVEFWFRKEHACGEGTTPDIIRAYHRMALDRIRSAPPPEVRRGGVLEMLQTCWLLRAQKHPLWLKAEKTGRTRLPMMERGGVLAINPVPCYDAYAAYYRLSGREPWGYDAIAVEARHLKDPYWLGIDYGADQTWQFSLVELRRMGLCLPTAATPPAPAAGPTVA